MRRLLIASSVLTMLGAISVALSSAASAGDTTVDVEVAGGSLSISSQPAAATVAVGPDETGGAGTALGGALTAASTPQAIATGTNATLAVGDVTYRWNPQLSLVVPAGTAPQTYRGTVTLTVA